MATLVVAPGRPQGQPLRPIFRTNGRATADETPTLPMRRYNAAMHRVAAIAELPAGTAAFGVFPQPCSLTSTVIDASLVESFNFLGKVILARKVALLALGSIFMAGSLSVALGQSKEQLFRSGMRALEAKDFTRAQESFAELVKTDPSSTNLGYLAVAESGAGNIQQAIADFNRAIKLGNDSVLMRYGLGSAYLRDHQPEAAARELRAALAKDPGSVPARYALGVALVDLGQGREAIPYLERARAHSPSNPQVWVSLMQAQFQAGNPQAAMKLADDATETIPDNPQLLIELARLCLRYRQPPKARTLLESAVELQPHDTDTRLLLAEVCVRSGNPGETLEILRDLPAGSGKPGEAMILTAEARALTGNLDLARTDVSLALEADPANPDFLVAAAWLDQLQSRFEPALDSLKKARALAGDKPEVLYSMGVSYYFLGNFAEAAESCQAALHADAHFDLAALLEGLSKLELKQMAEARAALERAVALNPQSALDHRELGAALLEIGDLAGSEAELNRALALDPHDVEAYSWRAQVLEKKGAPQRAIEDLETATALDPKFAEAYPALARLYSSQEQAQKAAAMLDEEKQLGGAEAISEQQRQRLLHELVSTLP